MDLSERASQIAWIKGRFGGLTPGSPLALSFPVWRTGLYRVIDPAGTVSQLTFEDGEGRALTLKRSGTSRWEGTVPPSGQLRIRYRLYGNSWKIAPGTSMIPMPSSTLRRSFLSSKPLRDAPASVQLYMPRAGR